MNRELTQKLHRDYMTAYRITEIGWHGIFLIIIAVYYFCARAWSWTFVPAWVALAAFVVSFTLFTWLIPGLIYARFRYELFEDELEIKKGVMFISNVLVPMVRVQHVELESGPLMRKYDLAAVSIVTAATTHRINGLKLADAERLKRRIGMLAKVDDQDE